MNLSKLALIAILILFLYSDIEKADAQEAKSPLVQDFFKFDPQRIEENLAQFNLYTQVGVGSYYADRFHGRKTSSGDKYNKNEFSAAHKKLRFGTIVKVINLENDLTTIVQINDRGPYARGRIIDLSKKASKLIEGNGTSQVRLETIEQFNSDIQKKKIPYYNGFSMFNDLVCLPFYLIEIIDSTSSFNQIMNMYLKMNEEAINYKLYIFERAYKNQEDRDRDEREYYLGYVRDI